MPTPVITPTEYVILFIARNIVACTLQINPGVGPPTLQDSGGPGPAELFSRPLRPAGVPTSAPNAMSRGTSWWSSQRGL